MTKVQLCQALYMKERGINLELSIKDYKGIIACPYCGEKTIVKADARGQASHHCRCGKLLLFDYDKMTASPMHPLRGAMKYFQEINKIHNKENC
jgi:DNA-directed RNA polymerase subunit RPC12/RpoP